MSAKSALRLGAASIGIACLLGATGSQAATTLDFENLAADDTYLAPNYEPLVSGQFRFMGAGTFDGTSLGVLGRTDPLNANPGGASLFLTSGGFISFGVNTADYFHSGFELISFDVAELANDGSGGTLVFGGTTIQLDDMPGFQTITVNKRLRGNPSIYAIYPDPSTFQFSNIVVDNIGSYVPEPATWAIMLIGFGVTGSTVRRHRAQSRLASA